MITVNKIGIVMTVLPKNLGWRTQKKELNTTKTTIFLTFFISLRKQKPLPGAASEDACRWSCFNCSFKANLNKWNGYEFRGLSNDTSFLHQTKFSIQTLDTEIFGQRIPQEIGRDPASVRFWGCAKYCWQHRVVTPPDPIIRLVRWRWCIGSTHFFRNFKHSTTQKLQHHK